MKKIRFGIIGCSSIADRSTLPAMLNTPNVEIKMMGSRNTKKAKKFAQKFSCNFYGSYDEVLENDDVDAVYISLPIGLQEKWIIKSAKSGKHILCEKSAVTSFHSAKKVIHAVKTNKVRLLEGLAFRFHPQHNKVINIIQQNVLGNLFSFTSSFGFKLPYSSTNFRFRKDFGGGALNDVGCYPICASRIMLQNEPTAILCNLIFDKKTGIDLKGSVYMIFPKNQVALLTFGYNNYFQSTYSLWGNNGFIRLERSYNVKKHMITLMQIQYKNKTENKRIRPADQFKLMINEFCKELRHPNSSSFNFEQDLLKQAFIMDAARNSSLKKKIVHIKKI